MPRKARVVRACVINQVASLVLLPRFASADHSSRSLLVATFCFGRSPLDPAPPLLDAALGRRGPRASTSATPGAARWASFDQRPAKMMILAGNWRLAAPPVACQDHLRLHEPQRAHFLEWPVACQDLLDEPHGQRCIERTCFFKCLRVDCGKQTYQRASILIHDGCAIHHGLK